MFLALKIKPQNTMDTDTMHTCTCTNRNAHKVKSDNAFIIIHQKKHYVKHIITGIAYGYQTFLLSNNEYQQLHDRQNLFIS